jgi:DNA repair photolyase
LEGLTGQLRRVAPLFASPETNPRRNPLVLLTKSANVQYLDPLVKEGQTHSVVVTFSLNPEPIADLWEGKYQDGLRITPPIAERLRAMREAQRMGFEVRARIDPILPAPGWPEMYRAFFHDMAAQGLRPTQLTRGTYRSKNTQLDHWREAWGLPPMEYAPEAVAKEGTHNHLVGRLDIYHEIQQAVREAWHPTGWQPWVSLCKETFGIRKEAGMRNGECNCLCAQRRPQSATSHDARLGLSGMQRPIVYG